VPIKTIPRRDRSRFGIEFDWAPIINIAVAIETKSIGEIGARKTTSRQMTTMQIPPASLAALMALAAAGRREMW
jgi:hypothetical protein